MDRHVIYPIGEDDEDDQELDLDASALSIDGDDGRADPVAKLIEPL